MHVLKVTIALSNVKQRIIPLAVVPANSASFSIVIFQNNGSNNMWIGDSGVTVNNGILLFPTSSMTHTTFFYYYWEITEFYFYGTLNDILNVMVFD